MCKATTETLTTMGKLRSPASPPSRTAPSAFPRMDPPPPYEASSSRSSSAHSHDRLNVEEPAPTHQQGQLSTPSAASQTQQQTSRIASEPDHKRKTEEGCLTFGDGASGCMVYGKNAEGCMNYGDNVNGCMNYGDNADGWYVSTKTRHFLRAVSSSRRGAP